MATEFETPEGHCLACGYEVNAATGPFTDEKPSQCDITICIMCGHLMAFNSDLTLRELTSDEMHAVAGDERILKIQKARAVIKK